MKFYFYILFLSTFLIFASCETENKITFSEVEITIDGNSIVSINMPKAEGNSETANKINNTIQDVISESFSFGQDSLSSEKNLEKQIQIFNNQYNSFKEDFPKSAQEWEAQIEGDLMYQSSEIISIALSSYLNTGGAHGILTIRFLNFDAKTGLQIENNALFDNIESIKAIAESYFDDFIKENDSEVFKNDGFSLPQNIGFEDDGVVMLYNAYEIAPYSEGIIQFTIPYSKVSLYLNYN